MSTVKNYLLVKFSLIKMTTKQKCEKLANALESVASKLRDPERSIALWERNEPSMQSLVAQVHLFLKREMEANSPNTVKKGKKPKDMDSEEGKDYLILHDWPDILS